MRGVTDIGKLKADFPLAEEEYAGISAGRIISSKVPLFRPVKRATTFHLSRSQSHIGMSI